MNYDALVRKLRKSAAIYEVDPYEVDPDECADAIVQLQARVAELELQVASWMRAGDWQQRAERAKTDLAAALAEKDKQ